MSSATVAMNISSSKAALLPLAFFLAVVVSPWVVIGTAIPYSEQDFSMNDDLIYNRGAHSFFHNHELDYQHWASPALLGQWLWSVPFLAVLGDSYMATRVSTIVLSWLGLWAFYTLLRRQAGVSPRLAAFATACLAWNPYFFVLSGSFMNDVPGLSFALIALALYTRALDNGRLLSLAAAVLAALVAIATRQNAIVAPLTASVSLLRSGYRAKPLWIAAFLAPIAFFFVLDAWLSKRPDAVVLHARLPNLDDLCWLAFTSVHYLGLLAAPLLVLLPPARLGKVFWAALAAMTAGALWLIWQVVIEPSPLIDHRQCTKCEGVFPYLADPSIGGVCSAHGTYVIHMPDKGEVLFSWSMRLLPTVLGCICAAALAARAIEQGWRLAARRPLTIFSPGDLVVVEGVLEWRLATYPLVIFSLLHLAVLIITPTYFDRYLLPLLPGVLALAACAPRRPCWKAGLAALVLLGGLSVCLMHDWLSWNAARWSLGRRAVAHGIEPGDIHGGFEWNQWYRPRGEMGWHQWNRRNDLCPYQLSLSPSRDRLPFWYYVTIDAEPFTRWFPPRKGAVYLQQVQHGGSNAAARSEADEPRKEERPSGKD